MATQAQIEANRKNARRSTGPKTARGKARSSSNAMRHGLLSRQVMLPDEDTAAFADFSEGVRAQLAPRGQLEELLAERVIVSAWRLRRVYRLETGVLTYHILDARVEHERSKIHRRTFESLARMDSLDVRAYDEATTATEMVEAERDSNQTVVGWVRDANGADMLSKLSRYETTLERGMYRALHELQRLQASRSGQAVLPPAVVDVEVASH